MVQILLIDSDNYIPPKTVMIDGITQHVESFEHIQTPYRYKAPTDIVIAPYHSVAHDTGILLYSVKAGRDSFNVLTVRDIPSVAVALASQPFSCHTTIKVQITNATSKARHIYAQSLLFMVDKIDHATPNT